MEQDKLKIQDNVCICTFTIRDLTCLLMATAHTYRAMLNGDLDDNEGFKMMTPEHQHDMMEQIRGLRPQITEMIFQAIGQENSDKCMAFVEQKMREQDGTKPN